MCRAGWRLLPESLPQNNVRTGHIVLGSPFVVKFLRTLRTVSSSQIVPLPVPAMELKGADRCVSVVFVTWRECMLPSRKQPVTWHARKQPAAIVTICSGISQSGWQHWKSMSMSR
jgi:hypothetical protein